MRRFLQVMTLGLLVLLPVACLQQQKVAKDEEEKAKVPAPLYLGSVHQVYPNMKCALLRIIGPMPSPGSTLISHPADGSNTRIGNLCVTPEKPTSNGYIMAELRSGQVMKGDRVFVYRDLATIDEKEQEEETEAVLNDLAPDLPSNITIPEVETPQPVATGTTAPTQKPADSHTETPVEKPSSPVNNGAPGKAPSYLDKIPDNINDWD